MMYYDMPDALTPLNAFNLTKYIKNSPADSRYEYDFSRLQHCRAFGLLLLANAIRKNKVHYSHAKHDLYGVDLTQGTSYAADMGFFQSCGWDEGRKTSAYDYGVRHIPIKNLTLKDLREKYGSHTIVIGEMVEQYADELAVTLTQSSDSETTKILRYCIREMMRNVFEHSGASNIWVCGQYWPHRNEAEIAILDEGSGILNSLSKNRRFSVNNDIQANKLSLQPGVSRMTGLRQDPDDPWQNSGYGLYMASSICAMGGYFVLCSGKNAIIINDSEQNNYETDFQGTAIGMIIRTNQIENLDKKLRDLSLEGSKIAKQQSGSRVLTASKVSTIASVIRKIGENKD